MGRPLIGKQPMTPAQRKRKSRREKRVQDDPKVALWVQHEAELAAATLALPQKKYNVIDADPGWRFAVRNRQTGLSRAADIHYATASTEDICAIPVPKIAAKDCVLLLWATVLMLPDALKVVAAWGFTYKSGFAWVKDKIGLGFWNRNQHELLLLGTRGHIPASPPGLRRSSVIQAPRRRHSQKPEEAYELIESYFPHLPKVELFARAPRAGFDGWGLEYSAGPTSRDPEPSQPHEAATARKLEQQETARSPNGGTAWLRREAGEAGIWRRHRGGPLSKENPTPATTL
jgi:N6-adenosine-specific RNA methylase IME4